MNELTREQVELRCKNVNDIGHLAWECNELLAHDAALRATITQQAQAITRLKEKWQGRRSNLIDYYEEQLALVKAELAAMTREKDEAMGHAASMSNDVTHLGEQLATAQAQAQELKAWRTGGVTEEILRKHDGWLKVGKGCLIVREDELHELKQTVTRLEEELEAYAWTISPTMAQAKIDGQNQQLAKAALLIQQLQATLAAREERIRELEDQMNAKRYITNEPL